jgi:ASPM-SPD-2-Hydin domain-containing protein
MNEKNGRMAHRRMVAGRGILRNHGRINNSPATATGHRTGTLAITFGGTIPSQSVALSGVGAAPAVSLSPPALYFGVQAIGTTSGQQQVTVTNNGTGPLTVSSAQTTAQFGATNTCGAPVVPGSNCTIQVTFTPTSSGIQTGTLTVNDDASNSPQTIPLTGNQTGTAAVTLSPTSLAFAVQNNGTTSAPQTLTITNSGTAPLSFPQCRPAANSRRAVPVLRPFSREAPARFKSLSLHRLLERKRPR